MTTRPITEKIPNLRQRCRTDGSWRIWWEPRADAVALGFSAVQLDPLRPTWSARAAKDLNDDLAQAKGGATRKRRGRTITDLIANYRKIVLSKKSEATQRSYHSNLNIIDGKWGNALVIEIDMPTMFTWYETNCTARGINQAQKLNGMMSILFKRSEKLGWRARGSNPCADMGTQTPPERTRIATWAEFDMLISCADELGLGSIGDAVSLSMLQGQRQTDVYQATLDQFDQVTVINDAGEQETIWKWEFIQSKRKKYVVMPVHPDNVALVERRRNAEHLLVCDRTGQPYQLQSFQTNWKRVRNLAISKMGSIKSLQFRDLRKSFAVMSDARTADIENVMGNTMATNPKLKSTYLPPQFANASRAVLAIQRPKQAKRKKA